MQFTRAFLNEPEFAAAVAEMEQKLKPKLIRLRYRLEDDWTGAPAVFFTAIVPREAFEKGKLGPAMESISRPITFDLEPWEKWGVFPYFRYLTEADVEQLQDLTLV